MYASAFTYSEFEQLTQSAYSVKILVLLWDEAYEYAQACCLNGLALPLGAQKSADIVFKKNFTFIIQ